MEQKRIICQKCINYYVTWKQSKPHGCNAYGFESQQIPSLVVKNSSKMDCSFYKQKQR